MNTRKRYSTVLATALMVAVALVIGGILITLTGNKAFETYGVMLSSAFASKRKITELFVKLIPILLMALGISVAFRAKLWNIGAQGQFTMAAIASTAVGLYVKGPAPVVMVLAFLASVVAGGLWAMLAGWMKNRFNANEVITTLMLNYIADYFLLYLINGPMQDPYSDLTQSDILPDSLHLPVLMPLTRLHTGIFVLIVVIVLMIFFWKTSLGYKIDLVGQGSKIATYAGLNVKKTVLQTMFISGALSGIAGWNEVYGIQYRLLDGMGTGYGDIANIIALMGALNVAGICVAAIFFSILLCGGAGMQRMTEVPYSVVSVIEGLIIVLVIARDALGTQFSSVTTKRKISREERK